MSLLLIWLIVCGAAVNAFFGLFMLKAIFHIAWAFCAAFSRCRFSYAVGREHGFREGMRFWPWVYWPKYLFRSWWDFIGSSPGSIFTYGAGGWWEGIGKWTVYPATKQPERE